MSDVKARVIVKAIADEFKDKALSNVAEGMELLERSVRLSQLERLATDEQCEDLLENLVKEGLVVIVEGEHVPKGNPN